MQISLRIYSDYVGCYLENKTEDTTHLKPNINQNFSRKYAIPTKKYHSSNLSSSSPIKWPYSTNKSSEARKIQVLLPHQTHKTNKTVIILTRSERLASEAKHSFRKIQTTTFITAILNSDIFMNINNATAWRDIHRNGSEVAEWSVMLPKRIMYVRKAMLIKQRP